MFSLRTRLEKIRPSATSSRRVPDSAEEDVAIARLFCKASILPPCDDDDIDLGSRDQSPLFLHLLSPESHSSALNRGARNLFSTETSSTLRPEIHAPWLRRHRRPLPQWSDITKPEPFQSWRPRDDRRTTFLGR